MDSPTIGEQIMLRRRQLSMTQAKLAKAAHISRNTLTSIENNRSDGRISTLTRIADVLKCRLSITLEEIQ